jgi:hypothetical protein
MTLAETVQPKLSSWRPAGPGASRWRETASGWTLEATILHAESLGCEVAELTCQLEIGPDPLPTPALNQWATQAAATVTAGLDPLTLIELDAHHGCATLRSRTPTRRPTGDYHFELRLHEAGSATLQRYFVPRGAARRQAVPFTLTHETVALLLEQITEAGTLRSAG